MAQLVKNPPAMQETWVRSLGWEDPLEKGKATPAVFWPREFHGLYNPRGHKETGLSDFHSPQTYWLKRLFELSNALPYSTTSAASFNLVSEFGISCILRTFVS